MTAPPERLRVAGEVLNAALRLPLGRAARAVLTAGALVCVVLVVTAPRHPTPLIPITVLAVAWATCTASGIMFSVAVAAAARVTARRPARW